MARENHFSDIPPDEIRRLAEYTGREFRLQGNEYQFKYCPFCNGGQHRDKNTFALNAKTGTYNCLRSTCEVHGNYYTLARHVGYPLPDQHMKKETAYRKPPVRLGVTNKKAHEYLEARGIPNAVTDRYQVIDCDSSDGKKLVLFRHFDENGEVISEKFRDPRYKKGIAQTPKEWFAAGMRPVLYGMENCTGSGWLVLTEGQIDALSLAAAGIENPVSVPNGAQGFTWCEYCREFVEKYSGIVVFGDNEQGKITLAEKLGEKMPQVEIRVVDAEAYQGCKDANEILQKFGLKAARQIFRAAIDSAQGAGIPGVIAASDVPYVDLSEKPRIPYVGFSRLRSTGMGLFYGEVTVLAGASGKGKSTLAAQIVADSVLTHGVKAAVLSAEMGAENTQRIIMRQMIGRTFGREGFDSNHKPKKSKIRHIQLCQKDMLWYIEYDLSAMISGDDSQLDRMVRTVQQLVTRAGVRLVLIDNLMSILDVTKDDALYQAQNRAAATLANLARTCNLAIILVAHTKKCSGANTDDYDNISGSANIVNLAGQVLMVSEVTQTNIQKYAEWRSSSNCTDKSLIETLPPDTVRRISVVKNRYGKEAKENYAQFVTYAPDSMLCISVDGGDIGAQYRVAEQSGADETPF